jgi:hypothetical protein
MRHAIIDLDSNEVVNIIDYDVTPDGCPPGFEGNKIAFACEVCSPGWHWDPGTSTIFDPDPPEPVTVRRLVPKSLIISRLTDEQLDAALAAMTNRQKERWRAPDKPAIYADDPEAVALIEAIGADPEVVMAPE